METSQAQDAWEVGEHLTREELLKEIVLEYHNPSERPAHQDRTSFGKIHDAELPGIGVIQPEERPVQEHKQSDFTSAASVKSDNLNLDAGRVLTKTPSLTSDNTATGNGPRSTPATLNGPIDPSLGARDHPQPLPGTLPPLQNTPTDALLLAPSALVEPYNAVGEWLQDTGDFLGYDLSHGGILSSSIDSRSKNTPDTTRGETSHRANHRMFLVEAEKCIERSCYLLNLLAYWFSKGPNDELLKQIRARIQLGLNHQASGLITQAPMPKGTSGESSSHRSFVQPGRADQANHGGQSGHSRHSENEYGFSPSEPRVEVARQKAKPYNIEMRCHFYFSTGAPCLTTWRIPRELIRHLKHHGEFFCSECSWYSRTATKAEDARHHRVYHPKKPGCRPASLCAHPRCDKLRQPDQPHVWGCNCPPSFRSVRSNEKKWFFLFDLLSQNVSMNKQPASEDIWVEVEQQTSVPEANHDMRTYDRETSSTSSEGPSSRHTEGSRAPSVEPTGNDRTMTDWRSACISANSRTGNIPSNGTGNISTNAQLLPGIPETTEDVQNPELQSFPAQDGQFLSYLTDGQGNSPDGFHGTVEPGSIATPIGFNNQVYLPAPGPQANTVALEWVETMRASFSRALQDFNFRVNEAIDLSAVVWDHERLQLDIAQANAAILSDAARLFMTSSDIGQYGEQSILPDGFDPDASAGELYNLQMSMTNQDASGWGFNMLEPRLPETVTGTLKLAGDLDEIPASDIDEFSLRLPIES